MACKLRTQIQNSLRGLIKGSRVEPPTATLNSDAPGILTYPSNACSRPKRLQSRAIADAGMARQTGNGDDCNSY